MIGDRAFVGVDSYIKDLGSADHLHVIDPVPLPGLFVLGMRGLAAGVLLGDANGLNE